jgi:hypothetical protein
MIAIVAAAFLPIAGALFAPARIAIPVRGARNVRSRTDNPR